MSKAGSWAACPGMRPAEAVAFPEMTSSRVWPHRDVLDTHNE